MSFHISAMHLNPAVYTDPLQWDPSRYLPDRQEDKKKPLSWLGWGAGRHPCLGAPFAKLEQNVIIALWLAIFDFELCDEEGSPVDSPPPIDLNQYSSWKPDEPVFIKLQPREGRNYSMQFRRCKCQMGQICRSSCLVMDYSSRRNRLRPRYQEDD